MVEIGIKYIRLTKIASDPTCVYVSLIVYTLHEICTDFCSVYVKT